MSSLVSSSRFPVVSLVLILAAFAGAVFYVRPLWDDVASMQKNRDVAALERTELQEELVTLQGLQQSLEASSEVSQETTLAAIPETLDQDSLLEELSAIARRNDIILNNVNFGVSSSSIPGAVTPVSMNASLTGSRTGLIGFLRGVESSSRKMLVKNISVQFGEVLSFQRVSFNLNMEAYYQGAI